MDQGKLTNEYVGTLLSNVPEDPVVARIWYEVAHLERYDLEWEWISEQRDGNYLHRDDVLALIARFLKSS